MWLTDTGLPVLAIVLNSCQHCQSARYFSVTAISCWI